MTVKCRACRAEDGVGDIAHQARIKRAGEFGRSSGRIWAFVFVAIAEIFHLLAENLLLNGRSLPPMLRRDPDRNRSTSIVDA